MPKVALFLDGGFVRRQLTPAVGPHLLPADINKLSTDTMSKVTAIDPDARLHRSFYYDCHPFSGSVRANPVDGSTARMPGVPHLDQLLDGIELLPNMAVRRGSLNPSGWKLSHTYLHNLRVAPAAPTPTDFVPDLTQKGVDMRIGLDIAYVTTKHLVDILVLVTGDSDFVPAMKFARREGLLVYLETLAHGVRRELQAHCDRVL